MSAVRRAALAATVPAALLLTTAPGALAADAAPAGCGPTVVSADRAGGQTGLLVTAPPAPAQLAPAPAAFHLAQGGRPLPATVTPVAPVDLAVAVVVASTAQTTPAALRGARDGALELLVGLPAQARTAVLSSSRATPLAALSATRAASTQSLRLVTAGGDSAAAAGLRAAALLPPGGHVVVLSDGTGDGTAEETGTLDRTVQQRGLVLDRVRYAASGAAAAVPAGCPTAQDPVLAQVDQVAAAIGSSYRVSAVLDPSQPATLTVDRVGTATVAAAGGGTSASPYAAVPEPAPHAAAWYAGAGLLGLLGLGLLFRRRRPALPVPYPDDPRLVEDARTPVGSGRR